MQKSNYLVAMGMGVAIALGYLNPAVSQSAPPSLNQDEVNSPNESSPPSSSEASPQTPASNGTEPTVSSPEAMPVETEMTPGETRDISPSNFPNDSAPPRQPGRNTRPSTSDADYTVDTVPSEPSTIDSDRDNVDIDPSESSTDANLDQLNNEDNVAPELQFLNPDPDPLQLPEEPAEVEIQQTQPITLQQALELARRNNRNLQVAELELERNRAALRESQAALYPTVGASGNATVQGTLLEDNQGSTGNLSPELEQLLGGRGSSGSSDSITTTLGAGLEVNYDLFTSGRRPALIRAAEERVRLAELEVERLSEQLRLDVAGDYYNLQEADEQVRISEAAVAEALRSLEDAQALERAGVGTQFDVLQAEVDLANSRQEVTQTISRRRVARRQLVRRLSLAETVDISAADPVEVTEVWELPLEDSIILAYDNRAELIQQLAQREISQQNRRAALASRGPQVGVFANYNVQEVLDQDDGFTDSYQLGARVSLNLFDGGAARARADQEEANIAIAETNFADARNQVRFEVEQAYSDLEANFENIETATIALQQAERSLRLARLRFEAGVGTQADVIQQQTELTRAEVNRVQAILGYNRSLSQLRRAVSNVAELDE